MEELSAQLSHIGAYLLQSFEMQSPGNACFGFGFEELLQGSRSDERFSAGEGGESGPSEVGPVIPFSGKYPAPYIGPC